MSEPLYEFVKGKGWIATPPQIITMACGTVCALERRVPKKGEKFDAARFSDPFNATWLTFIKSQRYDSLTLRYDNYVRETGYQFIVIVPL